MTTLCFVLVSSTRKETQAEVPNTTASDLKSQESKGFDLISHSDYKAIEDSKSLVRNEVRRSPRARRVFRSIREPWESERIPRGSAARVRNDTQPSEFRKHPVKNYKLTSAITTSTSTTTTTVPTTTSEKPLTTTLVSEFIGEPQDEIQTEEAESSNQNILKAIDEGKEGKVDETEAEDESEENVHQEQDDNREEDNNQEETDNSQEEKEDHEVETEETSTEEIPNDSENGDTLNENQDKEDIKNEDMIAENQKPNETEPGDIIVIEDQKPDDNRNFVFLEPAGCDIQPAESKHGGGHKSKSSKKGGSHSSEKKHSKGGYGGMFV